MSEEEIKELMEMGEKEFREKLIQELIDTRKSLARIKKILAGLVVLIIYICSRLRLFDMVVFLSILSVVVLLILVALEN